MISVLVCLWLNLLFFCFLAAQGSWWCLLNLASFCYCFVTYYKLKEI